MNAEQVGHSIRRRTARLRWHAVGWFLLTGGLLKAFFVAARDVTESHRAQEALQQLQRQQTLILTLSHEIRTPLTAIRAALGLLATGKVCTAPGGCQKLVATGMANADRLVRLVNDILDIERMESGEVLIAKKVCDAGDLLAQAVDLMSVTAESHGVRLAAKKLSTLFWADPDRMMQVLINLLWNAIKFSPPDTEVLLSAERVEGEIIFQVKDHGRGIPADKASLVFERFHQVDISDSREKGGIGLGLAICRSIVMQHGGRIWVESTPGCGSTFFFAIPADERGYTPSGKECQECLVRS